MVAPGGPPDSARPSREGIRNGTGECGQCSKEGFGRGGDHRHRTAWTADDRRQVEELMVRLAPQRPGAWRGASREAHGSHAGRPARLGLLQPAAAPATAPVDGVAAAPGPGAVADRRRGRLERPEDREGRSAGIEAPLSRLGLHAGVPIGPTRSAPGPRATRRVLAARQGSRPPPSPQGVPVVDDLGPPGGGARPRFERPLLAIWEGRVGIMLAVAASRLACNGRPFRRVAWDAVVRDGHEGLRVERPRRSHEDALRAARAAVRRSIEILDAARTLGNGGNPLVFPGRPEGSSTARRWPGASRTATSRPWSMASARRSATGRPRRRTIRARSSRPRSPTSSATTSRRRAHGRACLAGERPPREGTNACGPTAGPLRRAPVGW